MFRPHLIDKPDKEWLRSNAAALDAVTGEAIEKGNRAGKRALWFAMAKFMRQKEPSGKRSGFCQRPYALHYIPGIERRGPDNTSGPTMMDATQLGLRRGGVTT